MHPKPDRIPSLDSLRGLAALTVCLFHVDYDGWAKPLFNGHGAVVVFFVLSGFVLHGALSRTDPWAYLIARFFRLFPVVFASVALILLLTGGDWGIYFRNALLLETTVNGALWTIPIEIAGSVMLLGIHQLRRWGTGPLVVITIGLATISFLGSRSRLFWGIDMGLLYPFLVGYLAAHIRPKLVWPAMTLGASLVLIYAGWASGYVFKQWPLLMTVIGAAGLVLALAEFGDALQSPPLRLLGLASYSFYALHPIGLTVASGPMGLVAAPLVTLALAVPMYWLVERPGIAAGKRFSRAPSLAVQK